MKKTLLLFAFLLVAVLCHGQARVLFHMGAGTFRMKAQKDLQEEFRSDLPWRQVHKFPPYWTYSGSLSFQLLPKFRVGAWIEYGSTGGTLHYADYSGSARLDQLLHYTQYGLFMDYRINKSETWPMFITSHISKVGTKESLSYQIVVGNSIDEELLHFKSSNIGFRPGFMMEHHIKMWVFQASLGIEMQLPGVLYHSDGFALTNNAGDNVYAEWTGMRAQLGVGLRINGKRK